MFQSHMFIHLLKIQNSNLTKELKQVSSWHGLVCNKGVHYAALSVLGSDRTQL